MSREEITTEQLLALDADEKSSVLFFLTGYLSKDPKFQEALAAAYAAQMSLRVRLAECDPEGLALVQGILDRKAANGAGAT